MKLLLAIGLGSFLGGISRYLLTIFIQSRYISPFPYGTLVVNVTGCLLIGIVFGLHSKGTISNDWRFFLATGVLGGFTTFSAFSMETVNLLKDGQLSYAAAYIALSIFVGLAATFSGFFITRLF